TIGSPESGPARAFAGVNCAATRLTGDYPVLANARLGRDRIFIVPDASANPRLRFWQWFKGAPGSTRTVEIRLGTGDWQELAPTFNWSDTDWSRVWFDLRPFSGQLAQIAFRFQADGSAEVGPGW